MSTPSTPIAQQQCFIPSCTSYDTSEQVVNVCNVLLPLEIIVHILSFLDPIPHYFTKRRISKLFCFAIEHVKLGHALRKLKNGENVFMSDNLLVQLGLFSHNPWHVKFVDNFKKKNFFQQVSTLNTDFVMSIPLPLQYFAVLDIECFVKEDDADDIIKIDLEYDPDDANYTAPTIIIAPSEADGKDHTAQEAAFSSEVREAIISNVHDQRNTRISHINFICLDYDSNSSNSDCKLNPLENTLANRNAKLMDKFVFGELEFDVDYEYTSIKVYNCNAAGISIDNEDDEDDEEVQYDSWESYLSSESSLNSKHVLLTVSQEEHEDIILLKPSTYEALWKLFPINLIDLVPMQQDFTNARYVHPFHQFATAITFAKKAESSTTSTSSVDAPSSSLQVAASTSTASKVDSTPQVASVVVVDPMVIKQCVIYIVKRSKLTVEDLVELTRLVDIQVLTANEYINIMPSVIIEQYNIRMNLQREHTSKNIDFSEHPTVSKAAIEQINNNDKHAAEMHILIVRNLIMMIQQNIKLQLEKQFAKLAGTAASSNSLELGKQILVLTLNFMYQLMCSLAAANSAAHKRFKLAVMVLLSKLFGFEMVDQLLVWKPPPPDSIPHALTAAAPELSKYIITQLHSEIIGNRKKEPQPLSLSTRVQNKYFKLLESQLIEPEPLLIQFIKNASPMAFKFLYSKLLFKRRGLYHTIEHEARNSMHFLVALCQRSDLSMDLINPIVLMYKHRLSEEVAINCTSSTGKAVEYHTALSALLVAQCKGRLCREPNCIPIVELNDLVSVFKGQLPKNAKLLQYIFPTDSNSLMAQSSNASSNRTYQSHLDSMECVIINLVQWNSFRTRKMITKAELVVLALTHSLNYSEQLLATIEAYDTTQWNSIHLGNYEQLKQVSPNLVKMVMKEQERDTPTILLSLKRKDRPVDEEQEQAEQEASACNDETSYQHDEADDDDEEEENETAITNKGAKRRRLWNANNQHNKQ